MQTQSGTRNTRRAGREVRQDTVTIGGKECAVTGPTDVRQLRATRIRAFKEFAARTNRPWPILDWDAECEAQMESLNEAFPVPWPNAHNAYNELFLADEAAGHPDGASNI